MISQVSILSYEDYKKTSELKDSIQGQLFLTIDLKEFGTLTNSSLNYFLTKLIKKEEVIVIKIEIFNAVSYKVRTLENFIDLCITKNQCLGIVLHVANLDKLIERRMDSSIPQGTDRLLERLRELEKEFEIQKLKERYEAISKKSDLMNEPFPPFGITFKEEICNIYVDNVHLINSKTKFVIVSGFGFAGSNKFAQTIEKHPSIVGVKIIDSIAHFDDLTELFAPLIRSGQLRLLDILPVIHDFSSEEVLFFLKNRNMEDIAKCIEQSKLKEIILDYIELLIEED
jgi:hypothetical protein